MSYGESMFHYKRNQQTLLQRAPRLLHQSMLPTATQEASDTAPLLAWYYESVFSLFSDVARGLSNLLIFVKNQFLTLLTFPICRLSVSFISTFLVFFLQFWVFFFFFPGFFEVAA